MVVQLIIQLFALATIALLYAVFDIFNNRNVPNLFAYASVVIGLVLTFLYNSNSLLFSLSVALVIGFAGYLVYRAGMWGAGDYFELVAISLILPLQPSPAFGGTFQFGLPFVLSVFVATGLAAVWIVPIYYLIFVRRAWSRKPDAHHVLMGLGLVVMYLLLFLLASFLFGFSTNRLVLLFLVAVPSAVTLTFEGEITTRMIERMSPKGLEEGDIIAFNMMSPNEKRHFARYPGFGRLATKQLIVRLKREKAKLPVYRNAAPLAFFILIGVVISLLFGNLALLIV